MNDTDKPVISTPSNLPQTLGEGREGMQRVQPKIGPVPVGASFKLAATQTEFGNEGSAAARSAPARRGD